MKTLIVVDMQNDFINGSLGTREAESILNNVKNKISKYVENGDEIIFTQDTHSEDYLSTSEGKHLPVIHCQFGTKGWEIPKEIDRPECEHIIKETFGYADWEYRISEQADFQDRNFEEVEIIGLCTDICVVSNAILIKTFFPEVKITVDASCCAGVTPETHKAALSTMKMCQINVINEGE